MSENNTPRIFNFQKKLDSRELIFTAIKKWYIIVITMVVFLIISLVYTTVFVTPMYESVAKVIVFNKQETTSANDLELSSSLYLAKDFKEIITDKLVLSQVSAKLGNKYTIAQLKNFISIENPQSTRIIEISALSPKPEDSKKIVDTVCEVAQSSLVELMGLDRITLISNGDIAQSPSKPNLVTNIWISIVSGLALGIVIVLAVYITDNKVATAEDVERLFGITVLATIPYNSKQKNRK